MFVGRKKEILALKKLRDLNKSSLVVCRGRRRIGKSELVRHFAKTQNHFLEVQGLAPRPGLTKQEQLLHFYSSLGLIVPRELTWSKAFEDLAAQVKRKKGIVILLDEISWMAIDEPDFAGFLKIAWDTHFSKLPEAIVVICGSVSSWIEENILNSTAFLGRISLALVLDELPIVDALKMLEISSLSLSDQLKILCLTGGVPKYLEEINPKQSLFENLKRLWFTKSGFLFNDFEKIFNDIFLRRSDIYRRILEALVAGKATLSQLSKLLKVERGGGLSVYLQELQLAGFVSKDYNFFVGAKPSKVSYYRLKDNYSRFYLKYIRPKKIVIESGLFEFERLDGLRGWDSIVGLQFENLILNNLTDLCNLLNIPLARVKTASPYTQRKTARTKGACQIDLLIELEGYELIICEFKFRANISSTVVAEILKKRELLKRPRHYSVRTALIYMGAIANRTEFEKKLDFLIPFDDFVGERL